MSLRDDATVARAVLRRHAYEQHVELADALERKTPAAVRARHGAWRELKRAQKWHLARIARSFGVHHTVVAAALRGCPGCGKPPEKITTAPRVYACGVATSVAYHHAGGEVCFIESAWVHLGEDSPAGGVG